MLDYQGARKRVPLRERMDSILGRLPETTRTAMSPLLGGPQGVGILDVLPGTGEALAADDYATARRSGDRLGQGIAALGVVPVVGAAGRGARVARAAAKAPRIRAYHGSPYEFDRFDLSKVGTGEGGQAYGHGLYLAEVEDVAQSYKRANSMRRAERAFGDRPLTDRHDWRAVKDEFESTGDWRGRNAFNEIAAWTHNGHSKDEALDHLRAQYRNDHRMLEAVERVGSQFKMTVPRGATYEVDILASPDELLDWDAPLSQQSEAVRDAVHRVGRLPESPLDRVTDDLRGPLLKPLVSRPDMVSELNKAGVPGIRYLDGASRYAGEGSHNYVIFDPDRIEILRRYGLLPPAMVATQQAMQDRPRRQEPPRKPRLADLQQQLRQAGY